MSQAEVDVITEQLKQRIASKTLSLPMLPQVTSQVLALVNNIDSDSAMLAKLIQSDQALAGHVMRIANSASYSPTSKMTSLQQATARLGMQNIADIAMAATMGPKLFKAPGFEPLVKAIWQISLATAVWAREIARQGRRNVETTFLCGLLFQIGKPAVLQAVLEVSKEHNFTLDLDTVVSLIECFQVDVGSLLAELWNLPAAVTQTILGVGGRSPELVNNDVVGMVRAAQIFSAITVSDQSYDLTALSVDPDIIAINFYTDDVQQLVDKADAIHDTIKALSI